MTFHKTAILTILVVLFTVSASAQQDPEAAKPAPLKIGDKAPAVDVAEWVVGKGKDPAAADGKTIYIVEFWATWCGPCKRTIPHMNEIHAKLKDKGVVIMGITKEDAATVKKFLADNKMEYNVGIDKDAATNKGYMAGVPGIPHAFIVGKDGTVMWHGHPMAGMEDVLEKILAGTYNPEIVKLQAELQAAQRSRDITKFGMILDKMIKAEPDEAQHYMMKVGLLKYQKGAADKVDAVYAAWAKGCNDDAKGLLQLAATLADEPEPDRKLMLQVAKRAVELLETKDAGK